MGDIGFFGGLEKNAGNVYMAKIDFANMFLWVCLLVQVYKVHIFSIASYQHSGNSHFGHVNMKEYLPTTAGSQATLHLS